MLHQIAWLPLVESVMRTVLLGTWTIQQAGAGGGVWRVYQFIAGRNEGRRSVGLQAS